MTVGEYIKDWFHNASEEEDMSILTFQFTEVVNDILETYAKHMPLDKIKEWKGYDEGKDMLMGTRMHVVLTKLLEEDADCLKSKDGETWLFNLGVWLGGNYAVNQASVIDELKGIKVTLR